MFEIQKLLPLFAAAAVTVFSSSATGQIRIEAAGLPTTRLAGCPQKAPLPCGQFYQYKVVGYYSQLSLGAAKAPATAHGRPLKPWNRLTLRASSRRFPIDIFKSSAAVHSGTGHQATPCAIWNAAKNNSTPVIAVGGNTTRPRGYVVLCVDFIPAPPRPRGQLHLTRSSVRAGEKAPLAWKTQR